MKLFKWNVLLGMMLVSSMTFTFIACGGDDDDDEVTTPSGQNNNGNQPAAANGLLSMLAGNTWYVIYESEDLVEIEGMAYNADGTATGFELKRRSSDNFTQNHGEQFSARYSVNGNQLTIIEPDGDTHVYQTVINSDGTLTSQQIKSDGTLGKAYIYYRLPSGKTIYDIMEETAAKHKK